MFQSKLGLQVLFLFSLLVSFRITVKILHLVYPDDAIFSSHLDLLPGTLIQNVIGSAAPMAYGSWSSVLTASRPKKVLAEDRTQSSHLQVMNSREFYLTLSNGEYTRWNYLVQIHTESSRNLRPRGIRCGSNHRFSVSEVRLEVYRGHMELICFANCRHRGIHYGSNHRFLVSEVISL